MINIALFASGTGSNAQKIMTYFQNHSSISVQSIVSNRKTAGVFNYADDFKVTKVYIPKAKFEDPNFVLDQLKNIDYIVLAGFLLKIPEYLVQAFPNKIINIHPALLPKFGGKGMYGIHVHNAVLEAGEKESGITIHLVDEQFDNGAHLRQESVNIEDIESAEDIAKKVLAIEHKYFAPTIEEYILAKD